MDRMDNVMKVKYFLFVFLLLILSSCQVKDTGKLQIHNVLDEFDKLNIEYTKQKIKSKEVFGKSYNGTKPDVYEVEGKAMLFYVYNSVAERDKGLEGFHKYTENANLVSFRVYEMQNILMFYVYEDVLNQELDNQIEDIKEKLEN